MQIAVGTYTGDGTDNRQITGIGFLPDLVIVRARDSGQYAVFRTSTMAADKTAYFAQAAALFANAIQSLDSDGFTVGTHATVNSNGVTYDWQAFADNGAPDFKVGTFSGDGTDSRNITGLGFDPDFVTIKRDGLWYAFWRTSSNSGDQALCFINDADQSNNIQGFVSDGFQVGTSQNMAGSVYHWFAFKAVASATAYGSYAGNNADDRSISGVGFEPDLVWVKGTSSLDKAGLRPSSITTDLTEFFTSAAAATNHVQALESDGFQVGATQNITGRTYRWFAWKSGATSTFKAASDAGSAADAAEMALALGGSDSGAATEAAAYQDAPHSIDEAFGDDSVADRAFGATEGATGAESGAVVGLQGADEAVTGTDLAAVGHARADSASATDTASIFPQTAAQLLEVDIANRAVSQVRLDVDVFYEHIASAVMLQVEISPLVATGILLLARVINQSLQTGSEGDVLAPTQEIAFL
jgi:hypothetical protein